MGLDMTITRLINTKTNEKGNFVYEYERIADFKNCWEFMEKLNSKCDYAFNVNAYIEFTGEQLFETLEEIDDKQEYEYVKEILEQAEVTNSYEDFYIVNAWW